MAAKGTKLYFSQFGGEQPIPPEFIAAMERKEEVQPLGENVTGPEALSDLIVESKVETDRTNERVRRTIKKKAGNITLQDIRTNDQGQPVQVTLTLFPTGTTPTPPTATTNVAIKDLGNEWSIQEVGVEGTYIDGVFTPGVFGGNLFAKERPNLVPEEFRPTIPTVTTRVDEAGTAASPMLSGNELREQQEQITQFKKRTTIDTQVAPSLPAVLDKGRDTNQEKQDVVVTKILDVDATVAPVATALKDVLVKQLGDGNKVIETREVSAVFAAESFAKERPNLTPEKFRPAIPTITVRVDEAGTAVAPTLSGDELREQQEQTTAFTKRTTIESQASVSLPISLTSYESTREQQLAVVVETLEAAGTAATTLTAVNQVEISNLGNDQQVQTVKTVSAVFDNSTFARERPNLVPPEFRATIPTITTVVTSAGTAVDPTLSSTELREQQEQITALQKRITTETQAAVVLPVTLDKGRETNQVKQDVIVTKILDADGATAPVATALRDVEVKQLGDGNKVITTSEIPTIFLARVYQVEQPNLIPQEFRPSIPTYTIRQDSVGEATLQALSAADLSLTEEQLDAFKKRTTQVTRGFPALPVILTGSERTEDGVGELTLSYNLDGTLASGSHLTLRDRIEPLGDGRSQQERLVVSSFPVTFGQVYDKALDVVFPFSRQKVPMETDFGVNRKDITIDDWTRNEITTWDVDAIAAQLAAATKVSHITIPNIDFPPTLTGITVTFSIQTLVGEDSHPSSQQDFTVFGTGSGGLSPSSSSQSSASIMPDIQPTVRENSFNRVPGIQVDFFVPDGSSRATILALLATELGAFVSEWPQCRAESCSFTLTGQSADVAAKADTRVSGGGSVDSGQFGYEWGNGISKGGSLNITTKTFSPTLHGAVSLSDTIDDADVEATAEASTPTFADGAIAEVASITNTKTVSETIEGRVSPTSTTSTNPPDVPTSGLLLFSLHKGGSLYDHTAYIAEIVDATNFI